MYKNEMDALKGLYEAGKYEMEMYKNKIADVHCFDSYEEFQKIPFSYKDEIRQTEVFERTTCKKEDVYGIFSSSGTTGKKTYYVYSKKDKAVHEEFVNIFYSELGISADDIGAVCAPIDTGVMAHTMMWQFTTRGSGYVNCPEPSPVNMVDLINSVPVTVVATRPDVVSTIAYNSDWVESAQKSKVKKLILGGGFLSNGRRKLLEKTWDAEVYNMFGMSEMFGPMAGECRNKNGQHYLNQYLFIELIDPVSKTPVKKGEKGIAVYSTLWDKGFPLLRYWTDDLMSISYEKCECGSLLPRIFYHGRLGDCITVGAKRIFPVMLEEILMSYDFIHDYQAEQYGQKVVVSIEKAGDVSIPNAMIEEIKQLFECDVEIKTFLPGELNYRGHGKRFFER